MPEKVVVVGSWLRARNSENMGDDPVLYGITITVRALRHVRAIEEGETRQKILVGVNRTNQNDSALRLASWSCLLFIRHSFSVVRPSLYEYEINSIQHNQKHENEKDVREEKPRNP